MDGLSAVQFGSQINAVGLNPVQSQQRRHPALDAAATLLGMSPSDLRTAMQSGQSLASIAASKGVSQDQLTSAMAAAITQANPSISADQASKVATAIATRTPPGGAPGGPGGPGQADDTDSTTATSATSATNGHHHHRHHRAEAAAVDATSQLLGMSKSDLISAMQSGKSLTQIAASKGVSQSDLVKAVSTALQGADSNLSSDQTDQLAADLVKQTRSAQSNWSAGMGQPSNTMSVLA